METHMHTHKEHISMDPLDMGNRREWGVWKQRDVPKSLWISCRDNSYHVGVDTTGWSQPSVFMEMVSGALLTKIHRRPLLGKMV